MTLHLAAIAGVRTFGIRFDVEKVEKIPFAVR